MASKTKENLSYITVTYAKRDTGKFIGNTLTRGLNNIARLRNEDKYSQSLKKV